MRSFFGFLLMLLAPLALVWIPFPGAGALVGGFLGGYVVQRPGRALVIALLPIIIIDGLALGLGTGLGLPLVGGIVAGIAFVFFLAHGLGLLVGAILGGFVGQSRKSATFA